MSNINEALRILKLTLVSVKAEIEVCDKRGWVESGEALTELRKARLSIENVIGLLRADAQSHCRMDHGHCLPGFKCRLCGFEP